MNMAALTLIILGWPLIAFIGWILTPGICSPRLRLVVRILLSLPCLLWLWCIVGALVFGGGF